MPTRRDFLAGMPALGMSAALSAGAAEAGQGANNALRSRGEKLALCDNWQFRLDPNSENAAAGDNVNRTDWQVVSVPHTWQALGGTPDYVGVAWYRKEIVAPAEWRGRFVRVEFEAVFHTARVLLNGQPVGEHVGKGYTAFCCDLSPHLKYGEANELLVRVDNSFSDTMLPRMKSFDWANDGGIIRPVNLLLTPRVFIERLEVDATPGEGNRAAKVAVRAVVRNTLGSEQSARVSGIIHGEDAGGVQYAIAPKEARLPANGTVTLALDEVEIAAAKLWHFDAPHLYEANVALAADGEEHRIADTFGIRRFEARGRDFYLNGERVSLMGVERMAGSHPEFGMAEPTEWIEANHRDMKELNCVFTRVHWAQDRRVLDFCDRHGILMQEEVPAWGSFTFENISQELQGQLEQNGLEQLGEMVARDRNHPCIVSWGLCNEVNGKNPKSREFAHAIAKEARRIDPARLLTYASHSLGEHPELDMAGDFDFISANEYVGSWQKGGLPEVHEFLAGIRRAFPDKPIVISEYGWCECQPTIPAGDENRVKIVDEHTNLFRESGDVAGAIYFDYNDYRTIVGDKGAGALRQRVHGVVDLYADRKPSFGTLRVQTSPAGEFTLELTGDEIQLHIVTRKVLPAYTLRGYRVRWLFHGYDDVPVEGRIDALPALMPGSETTLAAKIPAGNPTRVVVDLLRPGGFSAATAMLSL
ncbi:MAG: glycoside hydrolase family 2 TIM barrel-domain containing protein [Terracidiphilus sp.]